MKKAVWILIFLLPFMLHAQKSILNPQKNDNVIVVTTDTIDKRAFVKAVSVLINQGFTIREKNTEKGTLVTDLYDYEKGKIIIYMETALNEIKIHGVYEPNLGVISGAGKSGQFTLKVHYGENTGNSGREAWNIMDAFANQLAQVLNASVTYLKW